MTTLSKVSGIITPMVLREVSNKTKAEVDFIIAVYRPQQANPDRTRPVLVPKRIEPREAPPRAGVLSSNTGAPAPAESSLPLRSEVNLTNIKLSFEQKWKVEGVVSERVHAKLERCKKLLSRKHPKGVDYDTLFDELTELYLDKTDPERRVKKQKKRVAQTKSKTTQTRHIPAEVKDEVWKRDDGKCTFVGSNEKRCNSDHNLQFDHYPVPYARGGPSTVNNLRLLCAKHNRYTAEKTYGETHMKKFYLKEEPAVYLSGQPAWSRSYN
jgi:5-methylcytosine-specific restriction endonuclease McrA